MVRFILTDIEGTTTDVAFVHKVLFPYAARHLAEFVQQHADDAIVKACLKSTKDTVRQEEGRELNDSQAVEQLLSWIQQDRKHTALKELQGLIWKNGFEKSEYQGHVYPDVVPALERWKQQGIGLGIYSSGSVQAQKLMFSHSVAGDLTPYFSHYFDTQVGGKKDPNAYAKIAQHLNLAPLDILFLSDIGEELDAAAQSGFQVIQLLRGPEAIPSSYTAVKNFSEIQLNETSAIC